jgi:tRNA-2-methylthio-N6-dimethylallyladenosine synthase
MNRGYSREWYLKKVERIREILGPECGLSSDMITGFCSETEDEHHETLSLMDIVRFDFAYMFCYSERPGTPAAKKLADDVLADVKKRRLAEIIEKQTGYALAGNRRDIGKTFTVLIEGTSKRSDAFLQGRNTANKVVVFPRQNFRKGEYVRVSIEDCTGATLIGKAV